MAPPVRCALGAAMIALFTATPGYAQEPAPKADPRPGMHKVTHLLKLMAADVQAAMASGEQDLSVLSSSMAPIRDDGSMLMTIHAAGPMTEEGARDLGDLGAVVDSVLTWPSDLGLDLPPVGRIEAWVPAQRLADVAALEWIVAITPIDPGFVQRRLGTGPIVSEGVVVMRADGAQRRRFTGQGVTIGAVSDGVENLAEAQARGELPPFVDVLDPGFGDEGTAILEILADMAPGADLAFAAGLGSTNFHINALLGLAGSVDVITEDIGFFFEPKFQRGIVAAVGDAIADLGVSVHSSAGNSGLSHAENVLGVGTGSGPDGFDGPFVDCTIPPLNTVAFEDGTDTTVDVTLTGIDEPIVLQWSEPSAVFPTEGQGGYTDLDLYVLDETGTICLAESLSLQGSGVGDTIEIIVLPAELAGTQAKVVVNVNAVDGADRPPLIDLQFFGAAIGIEAASRTASLNGDTNYIGAANSVAALDARSREIQDFSSGGPVLLGLTTLFNGEGEPGLPGPGPEALPGPTFTGVDGVSISGVGGFGSGRCPADGARQCRFFGTSAAAPHAAACEALAREASGLIDPADLRGLLSTNAVDLAPAGIDTVSGAGLLDCRAAVLN